MLVRQRHGSAKGVMFITLEDETGIANLVVWPQVFEKSRRVVMSASMIAVRGRIQREGEVVHLVAHRLVDPSAKLATVGSAGHGFPAVTWTRRPSHGTPAAAPIPASRSPRACAHVTSMFRTCTSTSLKRRAGTSTETERRQPVRAELRGGGSRQNGVTELLVVIAHSPDDVII